jgi:hypothetical protein
MNILVIVFIILAVCKNLTQIENVSQNIVHAEMMTDFSSTSDVNIGNTEQIDDNPSIARAVVTNPSTSDVEQIIGSDDDTRETHQINNWEQNGGNELQHLEVLS